ncbi:MAG TPA: gliding motility lipoprotein GldH [Fluviicola sp.]|nr:gliding motility lipoprotein GldH [Fluviicola sp.]
MKQRKASWVFVLILVLVSCGKQPLYNKSYSFENHVWEQDVKPVFKFNIADTSLYYTVQMTFRVTTGYSHSNLWFFTFTKSPHGETGRLPYEVVFSNPDGSWAAETSGTIVEKTIFFKHRKFPQKGTYTIILEQGITEETVHEIMDVSLRVIQDENQ